MKTVPDDLLVNIKAGTRLARFRPVEVADFRVSIDQLVALVMVDLVLSFSVDFVSSLPQPEFYSGGFEGYGFSAVLLLFALYLVARLLLAAPVVLQLCVILFSALPFFQVTWLVLGELAALAQDSSGYISWSVGVLVLAWLPLIIGRAVSLLAGESGWRSAVAPLLAGAVWLFPVLSLSTGGMFWYANSGGDEEDPYAAFRDLDGEAMLFGQYRLLEEHLGQLGRERPGIDDVYFLGFAGWAHQDVFMKEAGFAKILFDDRFDTAGRSLLLANNLATRDSAPLATATNLQHALAHYGQIMDTENDVLVLWFSSHGSEDKLGVRFWPLELNQLTPGKLRGYLDDAGIRWRIIMVSACYSGSFVDELRNPYTVVLTASAEDRNSFGCGNENDLTYFGEALLKNQLQTNHSIERAYRQAAVEIEQRERAEELEPSMPQMFIGVQAREKIEELAARFGGETPVPCRQEGEGIPEPVDVAAAESSLDVECR